MKFSMGSWAFSFGPFAGDPFGFEQIVAHLSQAGYDGVEVCGFPPHVTLETYPAAQSRRELARFLEDHRMGISGYHADFTTVNPVLEDNRERYLDLFRRNVAMCADLGSPALRVDTIAAPGSIRNRDYQAAFDRLADLWREAAGIAQDAGVALVWEFEPGSVFNKPSEILALHEQVGHPNFRILFDTANAYLCGVAGARQHGARETVTGGVPGFLRKLKDRIGAIHLIDSDGTLYGDETSSHLPLGEGLLDFEALVPELLKVPAIEWWCIDLCFFAGSWDLVEPSRRFVLDLVGAQVQTR
jgi:sugar phosphate isomerase/epimerase